MLWVWGEMETAELASECDLAKGTLTGMVTTLERQGLVERNRVAADRRRVTVALTDDGLATIEDLFPRFNEFEQTMTDRTRQRREERSRPTPEVGHHQRRRLLMVL